MDRTNHSTKSLIAALCITSLCALFCLMAGCEEGMAEGPQLAAGPDLTETVNADLETVAKAAENALAEASSPEPEKVVEQEAVVADADEIAQADPVRETVVEADKAEPEPVAEQEPVVVIADEIANADPARETLVEADKAEPEPVSEQEPVVAPAEDSAKALPAAGIPAETIDPEPETVTEEQAVAEPVKEIGLTDPIPTKGLDITQDETDSAAGLDKMHIADAPLLGDNANPLEEHQEIQVQKQQVVPEAVKTKGFVAKYFVTPGSAVLKFTRRHFVILLIAVLCVAAWIVTRKKKLLSGGPRRRTNSDG